MRKLIVLALALATLVACVSVNSTLTDPSRTYAPVPETSVRIFQSAEAVPGDYTEVAILHAEGPDNWTDQADMYEKLREKAAELGANGVIVGPIEEPGTGEEIVSALFGTPSDREGKAIAIRWSEARTPGDSAAHADSATTTDTVAAGADTAGAASIRGSGRPVVPVPGHPELRP